VGIGTEATWESLLAGRSGIGPITRFDASAFSTRFAAEVKAFDPLQFIEKKEVKKMDIFIQFAIAASQFAMDDSGLNVTPEIAPRVGVFIASGIGGFTTIEREHKALLEGGPRRISPFFIPSAIINLASGQVSIRFGAQGPNSATCTACTASAHAVGDASEIIRRGAADAYHMTAPSEDGDGAYRVMKAALESAGVAFDSVDYINAHGTSTPHNDRIETVAIKRCFGEHARRLAISSTKSMTGHLLGAAGGLEAGICALAIRHNIAPPTTNLENPDEACDLDYVPLEARSMTIEHALSNSFGFGGTNSTLLLSRYNGD
jgi:3-oxoacyl-(acyl-carrier-protein) synthase